MLSSRLSDRFDLTHPGLAALCQQPCHPLHIPLIGLLLTHRGQGEADQTDYRAPEDEGHSYLGFFRVIILEDAVDKRA